MTTMATGSEEARRTDIEVGAQYGLGVPFSSPVSMTPARRRVVGSVVVLAGLAAVAVASGMPGDPADPATELADSTTLTTNDPAPSTPTTPDPTAATSSAVAAVAAEAASSDAAVAAGPPIASAGAEPAESGGNTTTSQWQPSQVLPTDQNGIVLPQKTPPELVERAWATVDVLPPPPDGEFVLTIEPLTGEPLERSTWHDGCPVTAGELRYLTASFWGFDDRPHQGELIIHEAEAEAIGAVFEELYEAHFPIEEMRIVTQADVDAPPTGDGNNTSSFVCRAVTGGTRFSEHAYGLAIDVNPFQNPYVRGPIVLPELAESYLDRGFKRPGMLYEGDVAVQAFETAGWPWGGRWQSLQDYQHFALNNR